MLASVPTSVFDAARDIFVLSWRVGNKDLDLGSKFLVKYPQLPYPYAVVEEMIEEHREHIKS